MNRLRLGAEKMAGAFCNSTFDVVDADHNREISGADCSQELPRKIKDQIRRNNVPKALQGEELNGLTFIDYFGKYICPG